MSEPSHVDPEQQIPENNIAVPIPQNHCGQCRHAFAISKMLNDPPECRWGPPQNWAIPIIKPGVPPGNFQVNSTYPRVARNNPACSHFSPRATETH